MLKYFKTLFISIVAITLIVTQVYGIDAAKDGPIYGDPEGLSRVEGLEQELHNMKIREDHPRIFITKETLPIYQARVRAGQHATHWANVKKSANNTSTVYPYVYTNMVNAAFAYLMLRADKPAEAATYSALAIARLKALTPMQWPVSKIDPKREQVKNMAIAFDWVYEAMTESERTEIANKIGVAADIATTAQKLRSGEKMQGETFHREEWVDEVVLAYPELALAYHFPDADLCFRALWNYDWIIGDAVRTYAYLADGTFPGDGYYIGPDGVSWLFLLKSGTGINLVDDPRWPWAKKVADQLFYRTDFWDRKREIFHHGVLGQGAVGLITLHNYSTTFDPVKIQSGRAQAMALSMNENPYHKWDINYLSENKFGLVNDINISRIMFDDPIAPSINPQGANHAELPLSYYMPDGNEVYMRSDWQPKSVIAGLRVSPAFTKSSHGDYDANSFMIYRDGNLSTDTGFYDAYEGQTNTKGYQKKTVAHNDILVIDPLIPQSRQWAGGDDPGGVDHVSSLSFGMNYGRGLYTVFLHQPQATVGDIVKYETTPEYDYTVGEAASIYGIGSSRRLNEYYRNVVFLRKGTKAYMIVFDRVESTNPNSDKRWLMHFVTEPVVNGNKISEQVPGHIDTYDGDYTVAKNVFNTSAIYVKTLLPQQHKIRRIGGVGYEFAVENISTGAMTNYPLQPTALPTYEARMAGPWQEGGTWRIELSPATKQARDYFLNVMYIGDVGETMVPVQYIEENGMAGVIINDPALGKNKILFTKTGSPDAIFTTASVSADTVPPASITNLSYSNLAYNSASLSWTAVGDDANIGVARQYDLRYSKNPITSANFDSALNFSSTPKPKTTGQTETMTLTGLDPLTTYYVAIKAVDDFNNKGSISNVISFSTPAVPADTESPTKPQNLVANAQLTTAILLSWSASTDNKSVAGYNIYRNNIKVGSASNTYYTDTGLTVATTYTYQVSAYDAANNESAKSDSVQGTTKSATTQPIGMLLSDNFDDNDMEGWSVVDEGLIVKPSKWYSGGGKLHQDSDIYGPAYAALDHRKGTFAYWNTPLAFGWKDYTIEYTFNTTDIDGLGLMFYYQDKNNYYKIDSDCKKTFTKLFLMKNGIETILATSSKYYIRNVDQKLKISINQGFIIATLNGSDIFSSIVLDSSLAQGTVAIYCWGSGPITFDDVKVIPQGSIEDTTPPIVSNIQSTNITSNSVTITWTTNESATSQVEYGLTTSYGTVTTNNINMLISHSVSVTGLSPNTTYHYRVISKDSNGNEVKSVDNTFKTSSSSPPSLLISSVLSSSIGTDSATITWTTNVTSTSQVEYGLTTSYGTVTTVDSNMVSSHSVSIKGLSSNTTYHYRVISKDSTGSEIKSADNTFKTTALSLLISSVLSSGIGIDSATITWTTNKPATSRVEYGLTTSYGTVTTVDSNMLSSHSVSIKGLSSNTTYHYRVISKDSTGSEIKSADNTFKTLSPPTTGQRVVTYQEGLSGQPYDRCEDAYIWSDYPDLSRLVNLSANYSKKRILVSFPDIIGNNTGQIPPNAQIVSAELILKTYYNPSNSGHKAYRVLRVWNESSVTWKNASPLQLWSIPGCDAIGLDRDSKQLGQIIIPLSTSTLYNWDIKEAAQAWVNGASNNGVIIIQDSPGDEVVFNSPEFVDSSRPILKVSFTVPSITSSNVLGAPVKPQRAGELISGNSVNDNSLLQFYWSFTTGSVDHYNVYLSTNDSDYTLIDTTKIIPTKESPYSVPINAKDGSSYSLKVQAVGRNAIVSKMSEPSDIILCKLRSPGDLNSMTKGDADGDLKITSSDFAILNASWNKKRISGADFDYRADMDYNDIVDELDAKIVSNNWAKVYNGALGKAIKQSPVASLDSGCNVRLISPPELKVGEETIINVIIEMAADLYSMDFEILYDPAIVEIKDIQQGTFFPKQDNNSGLNKRTSEDFSWISGKINQSKGIISPTLASVQLGSITGVDGNGIIARLKVIPKAGGISSISLRNIHAYSAKLNSIVLRQFDSVLKIKASQNNLAQNYPNPFNPETWIPYELAENCDNVTVTIYNALGQEVRRLELGNKNVGFYADKSRAAYWDGKNADGDLVASGIYFYQIKAGKFSSIKKMLVLK